jgi:hypothetical protein
MQALNLGQSHAASGELRVFRNKLQQIGSEIERQPQAPAYVLASAHAVVS